MIPQPIDSVPLFQRLAPEERQLVTLRLKRRQAAPGELLVSEGQPANTLFVITAGWVKLEGGTVDHSVTLANLGAGSLLGEVDLLLGRPYSMTARSAANTQLLTLTRADLEDLINERPSIGLKLSATVGVRIPFLEEYLVHQRLRNIELLSSLATDDLRAIAQRLDFRVVSRGDVIFEAGADGDAAYLIEQGTVRLVTKSNEGESFEDVQDGTLFGHTALMTGKAHASIARAVTDVTVWVLPRAVYQTLIRDHPAVKLALSRALAESLSQRDQTDAVERMRQLQLFADVPTDALSVLAARLVLRHFPADETIYTEGTPGDAMYIVDSGQVRLLDSVFSDARLLERIHTGEAFGEMALLTGRTRAECARAATDSTIWVLYKSDFDDLMVQYPEISVSLSRALSQRLASRESDFVIRHLRRINLFSNLATSELKEIAKRVRGLRFRPGEIICLAGQPAQTLYLIEKGEIKRMVTGSAGEPIMFDILDAGDTFGEQEIVQNTMYLATAQAMAETELWTISKGDFLAIMEDYPALALTITRLMADRLSRAQRVQPTAPSRPRPNAPPPPRPPVTRPPTNVTPPPPRVQQPPSGARPIRPATAVTPKPVATSPTPAPAKPRPPAPKPVEHRVQVPQAQTPKPAARPAVAPTRAQPQPRPRRENTFPKEFGMWLNGLSVGGKLRLLVLGLFAFWFLLVALPWTTITTVSSAVGGLQLSSPELENPGASKSLDVSNSTANSGPPKVAYALPTNTPVPTRTPLPTFTPRPKPTLAPATRTPVPAAPAVSAAPVAAPTLPPIVWDKRLGPGGLDLLTGVRIIPANVASGQKFWRITSVKFEDFMESGNDHAIYVKIFDENGKRVEPKLKVWIEELGEQPDPEMKKADDLCECNYGIGMFGGTYRVQIIDQYPSESITGMNMPMKRHVNFKLIYQLSTKP